MYENSKRHRLDKIVTMVAVIRNHCLAFQKTWGKYVGQVGRWEPTTKTCHRCCHVQDMPLDFRVFNCGGCRVSLDRDFNAALNVKRLGHQADGLGEVRHGISVQSLFESKNPLPLCDGVCQ